MHFNAALNDNGGRLAVRESSPRGVLDLELVANGSPLSHGQAIHHGKVLGDHRIARNLYIATEVKVPRHTEPPRNDQSTTTMPVRLVCRLDRDRLAKKTFEPHTKTTAARQCPSGGTRALGGVLDGHLALEVAVGSHAEAPRHHQSPRAAVLAVVRALDLHFTARDDVLLHAEPAAERHGR